MNLSWVTDIHLNFLVAEGRSEFYQKILDAKSDGVLISGDIAEAIDVENILNEMADKIKMPIYFVLGNHDYYRGQIKEVRDVFTTLTKENRLLQWLPASGPKRLTNDTILIGQDGWADGRLGDYQNSRVALNDSRMIEDLFKEKIVSKFKLLDKMQALADADAVALQSDLVRAVELGAKKVIVLTHVPPFKEACMHEGKISDNDWLPYFSSKVMGDVLEAAAKKNTEIEFLVLCGHTHGEAYYQPFDNLIVKAGKVEYGRPEIQEIITV